MFNEEDAVSLRKPVFYKMNKRRNCDERVIKYPFICYTTVTITNT